MNALIKKESEEVSSLFELISTQSTAYLSELHERQTTQSQVPLLRTKLDQSGVGTLGALTQFNERFESLMVGSSGPRYWGFVTGGTTPAAIAGDWLSTVYDQNPQGLQGQGDVSANVEIEAVQLLLDLFHLPPDFFGGFVTGATM
ncbi:MAG: aspartate aminotransferase family protein, partial [Cyclobacteriaceae bacterium]